jgi:hypothetical protein
MSPPEIAVGLLALVAIVMVAFLVSAPHRDPALHITETLGRDDNTRRRRHRAT